MAIQNPKNLYSGNAGIFNSSPYINFGINQLAQKQAKSDAIDQYYADQLSKVNGAGLAPSEQEALLGTKNNMLNYFTQNKKAIEDGDVGTTAGVNQYLSKMQDIIGNGKFKTEQNKEIRRINDNPKSAKLLTKTAGQNMQSANASIYTEGADGEYNKNTYDPVSNPSGYKPYDFQQAQFNAEPYTAMQMETISANSAKPYKPDNITYKPLMLPNGKPSDTQMLGTPNFSDNTVKSYMDDRAHAYNADDKLSTTVDNGHPFAQIKDEHADIFNNANDFYKKYTGKDITDGASLYAATQGMKLLSSQPMSKPITNNDANTAQKQNFATNKMYTENSLIMGRQDHAKSLKDAGATNLEDAWQPIADKSNELLTAQKNGYNITQNGQSGIKAPINLDNGEKMYGIPFNSLGSSSSQGAILKILKAQNIKSDGSDIFLKPNADGSKISIIRTSDGLPLTSISQQQVQLAANPSVKGKQAVLQNTPAPKPVKAVPSQNIQVQINGKVYKMPKGSLPKLDKDKVKYKIVN